MEMWEEDPTPNLNPLIVVITSKTTERPKINVSLVSGYHLVHAE